MVVFQKNDSFNICLNGICSGKMIRILRDSKAVIYKELLEPGQIFIIQRFNWECGSFDQRIGKHLWDINAYVSFLIHMGYVPIPKRIFETADIKEYHLYYIISYTLISTINFNSYTGAYKSSHTISIIPVLVCSYNTV